jgi:hypothetical protein
MAGLVPAIHALRAKKQGVDARHKAGHDVERQTPGCYAGTGSAISRCTASRGMCSHSAAMIADISENAASA